MIDGYTEICGIINDIAHEILSDNNVLGFDDKYDNVTFIATNAYYIGYTLAVRNDISKKIVGQMLACYCKDYGLDCIEIYDTTIFYHFIYTWDAMQGSETKLTHEEICKLIKENREECGA